MLFAEAFEHLLKNEFVTRRATPDYFLMFLSDMDHIWQIRIRPQPNFANHLFSVKDYLADDWYIVDKTLGLLKMQEADAALIGTADIKAY